MLSFYSWNFYLQKSRRSCFKDLILTDIVCSRTRGNSFIFLLYFHSYIKTVFLLELFQIIYSWSNFLSQLVTLTSIKILFFIVNLTYRLIPNDGPFILLRFVNLKDSSALYCVGGTNYFLAKFVFMPKPNDVDFLFLISLIS